MSWNLKKELTRKFVHILSLLILIIYFFAENKFNKKIALICIVFILVIFLFFEYIRIETKNKIPLLKNIWNYIRRKKEREKLGGDIFFIIGAIIVLAIFDIKIATAGILMTTFGDLSAALIGKKFGKHYLKNLKEKAWEGILAEFFVNIFIGIIVFFVIFNSYFYSLIWITILIMALTATYVETIVSKIDDNLVIPIFSSLAGEISLIVINYLKI
jgi:phytol kinase